MGKIKEPFFSVIIPTLNEEEALPNLLADLLDQNFINFEIIHVDGESSDRTQKIATDFAQKIAGRKMIAAAPDFQTLTVKKRNVSYQRNFGAKGARGKWLLFMDADNRLPKDFLAVMEKRLRGKNKQADVITTLIHVGLEDEDYPLALPAIRVLNASLLLLAKTPRPGAFGAMLGLRKELFDQGELVFNEKIKVLEDSLLVAAAKKRGFKFELLNEPTYAYSLRRVRRIGLTKTLVATMMMNLSYVFGDDLEASDHGYHMNGGGQYRREKKKAV